MERVIALQLNKLLNIKMKYKWLENIQVHAEAEFNGKRMIVGQILMKAVSNGIHLFNGIKQDSRLNSHNVYVYFKPNMTDEARKWIRNNYGKTFIILDAKEHVSLVGEIKPKEERVNKEIHNYIIERLKEVKIEENTKKKSYREVVIGVKSSNKQEDDHMELTSNGDTYKMSNRSNEEEHSEDSITEGSKSRVQTKMILELQKSVQKLQES